MEKSANIGLYGVSLRDWVTGAVLPRGFLPAVPVGTAWGLRGQPPAKPKGSYGERYMACAFGSCQDKWAQAWRMFQNYQTTPCPPKVWLGTHGFFFLLIPSFSGSVFQSSKEWFTEFLLMLGEPGKQAPFSLKRPSCGPFSERWGVRAVGTHPSLVSSVYHNIPGSFTPPVPGFSGCWGHFWGGGGRLDKHLFIYSFIHLFFECRRESLSQFLISFVSPSDPYLKDSLSNPMWPLSLHPVRMFFFCAFSQITAFICWKPVSGFSSGRCASCPSGLSPYPTACSAHCPCRLASKVSSLLAPSWTILPRTSTSTAPFGLALHLSHPEAFPDDPVAKCLQPLWPPPGLIFPNYHLLICLSPWNKGGRHERRVVLCFVN